MSDMEPARTHDGPPDDTPGGNPAVPPYEGRKESADVAPSDQGEKDGVGVGGASRPTEAKPGLRQPDPDQSPRGAVASPADEQPAAAQQEAKPDEGSTGPAHQAGVPRAEGFQ
jgi:hypothetical protein